MADQYRLVKLWGNVWALEKWGVTNFDGILDHDWKHVRTYDNYIEALEGYLLHKWGNRVFNTYPSYEAYEDNERIISHHETFDDALEYIEETSAAVDRIEEIGGSWDVFKKCDFCGEWTPTSELNDNGFCNHCEWYTTKGRC